MALALLLGGILLTAHSPAHGPARTQTAPRATLAGFGASSLPAVGVAPTADGGGWVSVTADGSVSNFGDAGWWGSAAGLPLKSPIVGLASTPSGAGYWLVASDGGIFTFGDAVFHGSTGAMRLNRPIVGMASTRSGRGYWLVASDGGIFSFGDAAFRGSTGAIRLVRPIVGMASTPSGRGYRLVASDGGIFTFGDATFLGSAAGVLGADAARALVPTPSGRGYWIATTAGRVLSYGDAPQVGGGAVGVPVAGAGIVPGLGLRLIGVNNATSVAAVGVITRAAVQRNYIPMLTNSDGSPVRWNPCAPIHYMTNLAAAPPGADTMVAEAVARISAATGIPFVNDGSTTTVPTSQSAVVPNPDGTWKPVIVGWVRPSQTDLLPGGDVVGVGGPAWYEVGGGPKVYVSGNVLIDPDNTASLPRSFGSGTTLGELLLHEFGHLVGLGHTADASQMMYPTLLPLPVAAYGSGDMAGLTALGASSGCLTTPNP